MSGWREDLKAALRVFRRAPGYAAVIVLTLGLGIGANSAIFSAINGVLLQPLPYAGGDRLVRVHAGPVLDSGEPTGLSPLDLRDFAERTSLLDDLVEYHTMFFNLLETGVDPERVQVGVVSWDFFQVVGVDPLHGRLFTPEEDRLEAEPVLILGHDYWQRRYGGDPEVVGRMVEMNNRPHRIVGVLPPVPTYPNLNDVWMPWYACPFRAGPGWNLNRAARNLLTVGRMSDGATLHAAHAEADRVAHSLHVDFPETYPTEARVDATLTPLKEELTAGARPTFLILMGMAALVLLIACANVANLTLARLNRRRQELAVRSALGARRGRLVRQLLSESLALSVVGAALAVVVAYGAVGVLSSFAADLTPRFAEVHVDAWVLAFTALVAVATGLVVGVGPALAVGEISGTLRETKGSGGMAGARARSALVVAQVGVATVLLIGSGLMLRSFASLLAVDPGYEAEEVLTVTVDLDWARYTNAAFRRDFYEQLLPRVRARPGVAAAAVAADFPMSGSTAQNQVRLDVEGVPRDPQTAAPEVTLRAVSEDYFETLGIELVRGRTLLASDDETAEPVAVVSRALAERHLAGRDPFGARISLNDGADWVRVVGVVGDVRQAGFDTEPAPEVYLPYEAIGQVRRLLVKTRVDPASLIRPVTEDILAIDPRQPVSFVQTLEEAQEEQLASPRTITGLLTVFGLIALVTATAGLFSVIAFSVGQQRKQIGIRIALGAARRRVVGDIFLRGMTLVGLGIAVGIGVAFVAGGVLENLVYGVTTADVSTFAGVAFGLACVAAAAILLPASRGTRISPMVTLRED